MFLTPSFHLTKQKNRKITHIHFPQWLLQKILQRTTILFCMIDLVTSMDCYSSLSSQKLGYFLLKCKPTKPRYKSTQTHTLWEEFLALLETSKLLIIPPISHQYQPLNKNFASLSTLRNGFFYTSIWDRDLKTNLQQLPYIKKPKSHYLFSLLHILLPLLHEIFAKCTSLGNSFATQSSYVQ